jgi:hypothetical protein
MHRIAFTSLAIALASATVAHADSGKTLAVKVPVTVGLIGGADAAKKMMGAPKIGEAHFSLPNISRYQPGIARVR